MIVSTSFYTSGHSSGHLKKRPGESSYSSTYLFTFVLEFIMPHNQEAQEKQDIGETILIVEDDVSISSFLTLAITRETAYHPYILRQSSETINVAREIRPALILLDHCPPRTNGITLYDQLRAIHEFNDIAIIIMGTYFDEEEIEEIKKRRLMLINKPFDLHEF